MLFRSCSSGGVWRTAKRDSTGYCSSPPSTPLQPPQATVHPPSTSSSLHLRLFIHGLLFIRSSSLHHALLHRLLFNQPSPHGLLFNHPSTGYYSSSPPPSNVHLALHGVVLGVKDEGCAGPLQWLLSVERWLRCCNLTRPLIRLQCIYNFLLFHAILYSVLDIIGLYYTLLYYFLGLTY